MTQVLRNRATKSTPEHKPIARASHPLKYNKSSCKCITYSSSKLHKYNVIHITVTHHPSSVQVKVQQKRSTGFTTWPLQVVMTVALLSEDNPSAVCSRTSGRCSVGEANSSRVLVLVEASSSVGVLSSGSSPPGGAGYPPSWNKGGWYASSSRQQSMDLSTGGPTCLWLDYVIELFVQPEVSHKFLLPGMTDRVIQLTQ